MDQNGYPRRVDVSEELREIVLDFMISCMLEQPEDLPKYGVEFFTRMCQNRKTPLIYDYAQLESTYSQYLDKDKCSEIELRQTTLLDAEAEEYWGEGDEWPCGWPMESEQLGQTTDVALEEQSILEDSSSAVKPPMASPSHSKTVRKSLSHTRSMKKSVSQFKDMKSSPSQMRTFSFHAKKTLSQVHDVNRSQSQLSSATAQSKAADSNFKEEALRRESQMSTKSVVFGKEPSVIIPESSKHDVGRKRSSVASTGSRRASTLRKASKISAGEPKVPEESSKHEISQQEEPKEE